jgi:hypothetical protein
MTIKKKPPQRAAPFVNKNPQNPYKENHRENPQNFRHPAKLINL